MRWCRDARAETELKYVVVQDGICGIGESECCENNGDKCRDHYQAAEFLAKNFDDRHDPAVSFLLLLHKCVGKISENRSRGTAESQRIEQHKVFEGPFAL